MARGNYWGHSFQTDAERRDTGWKRRGNTTRIVTQEPRAEDGQRSCRRGTWCAAQTRDDDGVWHPALTYQHFCPADVGVIQRQASELPGLHRDLRRLMIDPDHSGRTGVRTPPGSRVLVSPGIDALMREMCAVLAGWATRLRTVPGLPVPAARHSYGTQGRIAEDCAALAKPEYTSALLALPDGPTGRLYDLPAAGKTSDGLCRATASCRLCGRLITRSPASGWWWAPADGMTVLPAEFCEHQPAAGTLREIPVTGPVPSDLEQDIGDEEIVAIGEGWVRVMRCRSGTDAGLDILSLHHRAKKRTGQTPAKRERFDGVPCRECEEFTLERADPPSDPSLEAMHSRCAKCSDEMDEDEFGQWTRRWARSPGTHVCRRCSAPEPACQECRWVSCACARGEHPRRPAVVRPAA